MTYDASEISAASGIPIELYDIYDSDGTHYRYNTSDSTVTYLGNDYSSDIIERSDFTLGDIKNTDSLTIKLTRNDTFAVRFINEPIDAIVFINIYRQHEANYITYWSGYLISVSFDEDALPVCRFEAIISSNVRMGHRRKNMRMCPYILYETGCNVNQESYKVEGTITNLSGLVVTSSQFATETDGYWVGGKLKIGTAYRLIKAHSTNTITIDRAFADAEIGDSFICYAGCDHTLATCISKFSNYLNFGGNAYLPKTNPIYSNIGRQNG